MRGIGRLLVFIVLIEAGHADWTPTIGVPDDAFLAQILIGKQHIFAATFRGIYRSADEGATWESVTNGLAPAPARGMGILDGRIFAGTDSGLFVSDDDGGSWTKSAAWPGSYQPWSILVLGTDIYAGTHGSRVGSGDGVYRSKDRGATWSPANKGAAYADFSLAAIGDVLLLGTNATTYRSVDSGANWTPARTGAGRDIVEGFTVQGEWVFAGMYQDGVYRSSDSGRTWTPAGSVLSVTVNCMTSVGSVIFAGTGNGVEMSTNNGRTWSLFNTGMTSGGFFSGSITGLGAGRTHLFVGGSGPLFRRPLSELPSSIVRRESSQRAWTFQAGIPLLREYDIRGRRLPSPPALLPIKPHK